MKTQYLKVLAPMFIGSLIAMSAGASHAQGLQVSCATPIGVFPMPGGIPQQGLPCGNGINSGVTIVAGMPAGFPGGGFPGGGFPGGGFPGGGFPGGGLPNGLPPGAPPMGLPQVAGALGANREAQLAAECATAGNPQAVGACITARLTTAELQKCSAGIGTPGGCFGPNNTVRRFVENGISDIVKGPGPNNEFCKLGFC